MFYAYMSFDKPIPAPFVYNSDTCCRTQFNIVSTEIAEINRIVRTCR